MTKEITNLAQLLERIYASGDDHSDISLGEIVETVGSRSFGPLLLMAGLILMSPVGGIPGMPTTMSVMVLLIAGQMLFKRQHFWLPRWLLNRSASPGKVYRTIRKLRPVAHFVDRLLRPRLSVLIEGVGSYIIAIVCAVIAVTMPMMEIVPFSVHGAGIALTAFGLALIARDGLVALVAFSLTSVIFGITIYNIIFD